MSQTRIAAAFVILAFGIACSGTQVPGAGDQAEVTVDVRYEVFGMD